MIWLLCGCFWLLAVAGFLMVPTYLLIPELTLPLGLSQNLAILASKLEFSMRSASARPALTCLLACSAASLPVGTVRPIVPGYANTLPKDGGAL